VFGADAALVVYLLIPGLARLHEAVAARGSAAKKTFDTITGDSILTAG
jgi:hypothetical protein